jgi:hypothetical protein
MCYPLLAKYGSTNMKLHKVNYSNSRNAQKVQEDAISGTYIRTQLFKREVLGRTNLLLSFDTIRTSQKTTPPKIPYCEDVFT